VRFNFIPEAATRLAALGSEQIDAASGLAPADWKSLDPNTFTTSKILLEGYPLPGGFLNVEKFPTADISVRQAMQYAINRDEIKEVVFEGTAELADGIISTFAGVAILWPSTSSATRSIRGCVLAERRGKGPWTWLPSFPGGPCRQEPFRASLQPDPY
jgi:ABC-type transport system substrate-binding protein